MFHRNTLLTFGDIEIVVSTVGLMRDLDNWNERKFKKIGLNRYFETMAFHADSNDSRYHDANVKKQISFDSHWAIDKINADDEANDMHEAACSEITNKLIDGHIFPVEEYD